MHTNLFTRQQLLEQARKVLAGHKHVVAIAPPGSSALIEAKHDYELQLAIVAVLENYPLASPSKECVRVICGDLAQRGGFREVIEKIGALDWSAIQEHLAGKLAGTVIYTEPSAEATPPAATGENFDFA